jgi:hypothetical protein
MHRLLITRVQYLAELNARLRRHPAYVDGMAFVLLPDSDPDTAAGFDWVPGGPTPPGLFAEIAAEVHALFRVESLSVSAMDLDSSRAGTFASFPIGVERSASEPRS